MEEILKIIDNNYDNHVMPFFWQKGEGKDKIKEYMYSMKEKDIKECIIESRPFPNFCKQDWWEIMDCIIEMAKELDMKIWIFDDKHFPSGYANGLAESCPKYRKSVLKHRIINVNGPFLGCAIYKKFPQEETAKLLGIIGICNGKEYSLSYDEVGLFIYIDVPKGNWDIELFYVGHDTDININYINMIDKEACQKFIEVVYQPHYERYKEEFGKTIEGFFTDEPGFQNEKGIKNDSLIGKEMPLPWSLELETKLKKLFKDKFLFMLHYLFIQENNSKSSYAKFHYMNTVTKLYQENFDKNIGDWCRKHGVKHIGHIVEEREAHARLGVGCGHFFRAMSGQDMAGIDAVFNQLLPGFDEGNHVYPRGVWDNEFFHFVLAKMGTSLAHIDPKKMGNTMAEVFGAYGWHEGIHTMKWIVDHFVSRGVNYFVPHAFSMEKFPDKDCPPHFYAHGENPQFKYFGILMKYINKICTLFSNGRVNPEVAILYHAEAEWCGDFMNCQKIAKVLTQNQIQFDIVPTDIWKNKDEYKSNFDDGLHINGYEYDILVIPYCEYISYSIVDFIKKNTKTKIIFINAMPKYIYETGQKIEWRLLDKKCCMSLKEFENLFINRQNKKIKIENLEKDLRFYEYIKNKKHYYFLFNENPRNKIDTYIEIRDMNKHDIHYKIDLLKNKIEKFNGHLVLYPNESCIISGSKNIINIENYKFSKDIKIMSDIEISFASAKEYPVFKNNKKINSFVDVNRYINPNFSGTIRYKMKFILSEKTKKGIIILQDVYEIADVYIDNVLMGTCITEPYIFDINNINIGSHELVIDIINTLDKSICDEFSKNEPIKPSGLLKAPVIKF